MKKLMCVFMIAVCAFVCTPSFSEVPTFQHGQGCVGDTHVDKEQSKASVFVEFKSIVYEHIRAEQERSNKDPISTAVKADNSDSRKAQAPDEWGRQS